MKKVLMITYIFPPSGGAGVQRTTKFVKYLRDYGWQPVILTAKNPLYSLMDVTLLEEIPADIAVYKANEWMPNTLAIKLRKILRSGTDQKSDSTRPSKNTTITEGVQIRRLLRLAYKRAIDMAIPDQHLLWVIPAFLKARHILKKELPKVIYLSGPPFSVYLSGYLLSLQTNVPIILDFRDAWAENPLLRDSWILKRVLVEFMERRIIGVAKKSIFATQLMQKDYEKKYPRLAHTFNTITNGYDENDFKNVTPQRLHPISIVYMGRVTKQRKIENFLFAVKNLLDRDVSFPTFKVYFVGDIYLGHQDRIKELGLQGTCEFVGYLPHREALGYALGADVLLLLGSGDLAEMTGKLFEYLRAKRPIFAVVPLASEAGLLVRQSGHGVVAQYDSIPEITSKLKRLLFDVKNQEQLLPETDVFACRFERREQAKHLAEIMVNATKHFADG